MTVCYNWYAGAYATYKGLQGDSQCTRLPITINLMHTIKEQLRQSTYMLQEQQMLWAAFTMAFYGFFRVSELINLRWSDVLFSMDHISVSLHQSKTDPFRWVAQLRYSKLTHLHAHTMLLTATVK